MKNFNRAYTVEIIAYVLFFALLMTINYYLFLQHVMSDYFSMEKNYDASLIVLNQKKQLLTADAQTQKDLKTWKQNHPDFYAAITSNLTLDQLLQLSTSLAEKSGFSVVQAMPIIHNIQLQLSGRYQNLFNFINQLNQSAYPFTLTELKIDHDHQFDFKFSIENA